MGKPYKLTLHQWACNLELSYWSAMLAHQGVMCAEMMHGLLGGPSGGPAVRRTS